MIDFLDLRAVNARYQDEIDAAAQRVLHSGRYILGEELASFEREFAAYIGVDHAVGVANGTDALALTVNALGFAAGDEIIVPGNTYIASVFAVTLNGCTPVLAEPDARTYNIDPRRIEEKITAKTKAIMAVHLYGLPAPMDEVCRIAETHGLKVIEDASHAHGAAFHGRMAGGLSDAAGFSLYPTKNLGALGDGGIITTDDGQLAGKLRALRNYGSEKRFEYTYPGRNTRLDELQAAMLRVKLAHLEEENQRRREIAQFYLYAIKNPSVVLPVVPEGSTHSWHQFVVRCENRNGLREYLEKNGVRTDVHYPVPPHRQPALESLKTASLPVTEKIADEVLSLPINPVLTDGQAREIADRINEWKGSF